MCGRARIPSTSFLWAGWSRSLFSRQRFAVLAVQEGYWETGGCAAANDSCTTLTNALPLQQARLRKTKYRSPKHILPTQYMRSVNLCASNTA